MKHIQLFESFNSMPDLTKELEVIDATEIKPKGSNLSFKYDSTTYELTVGKELILRRNNDSIEIPSVKDIKLAIRQLTSNSEIFTK